MSEQPTRISMRSALHELPSDSCLVMICGPDLGKKYVLAGEDAFTLGRDDKNTIVINADNVSRQHACVRIQDGKYFVEDLGSTNGTYLNDEAVSVPQPLRSGDLIKTGAGIFKFLSGGNIETQYHEEIYNLTISDGLTQVANKRHFLEFLEREMRRANRYNTALGLVMLDIDYFKSINDMHGHLAGDYVLRELANVLHKQVRKGECFARYGGEEFAYIAPHTGSADMRVVAEKLRRSVEAHSFCFQGKTMAVTISLGVAHLAADIASSQQFIQRADSALYEAKRLGRNRVVGCRTET